MVKNRGKLPKFKAAEGKPIRVSRILDGADRTFWGPDQRPDAGATLGEPDGYNFDEPEPPIAKEYSPPLRWPEPGALLRVPQVVYLTVNVAASIFRDDEVGLLRGEASRLAGVFADAKEKVEKIRKNRTFVTLVDFTDPVSANAYNVVHWTFEWDTGTVRKIGRPDGEPHEMGFRYSDAASFPFLLLPAPVMGEVPDFFGTNFLHVYVGVPGFWRTGGLYLPHAQYWEYSYEMDPGSTLTDYSGRMTTLYLPSDYPAGIDSISPGLLEEVRVRLGACGKFHGYAARLYRTRVGSDAVPQEFSPAIDTNPNNGNFAQGEGLTGMAYLLAWLERWCADSYGQLLDWFGPGEGYDLTYEGDATLLDSASVVRLIAAHYGFNPETGEDLV